MTEYDRARDFIYRNARPIDLARWKYLFEDGSREEVVACLSAYQNKDGGFGHALEPDCWNERSTPLQTWTATRIIKEIDFEDTTNPLILGILDYLESGDEFDGHRWHGLNTVKSNNDYPHAPWWAYLHETETSFNPTASLIGFILKYAPKGSPLHQKACGLAREAYADFKKRFPLDSMHEIACFVELYGYIKECQEQNLVDLDEFFGLLKQQISMAITYQTDTWLTEYVCKPSMFIAASKSDFYADNQNICGFECDFIRKTQNSDGTWSVNWSWSEYPQQWAISKNWWKSDIIIKNMAFIKAFGL
ncbi:MAG: hypothetical protein PHT58_00560 [Eubacteriales bacterium]|nr:hypothetical protein [Eubacteriales bacterium]